MQCLGWYLPELSLPGIDQSPNFGDACGRTQFPVYSVMMGDTTAQRDIQINDVKHNAIVYKGNRFPVDVYLELIISLLQLHF